MKHRLIGILLILSFNAQSSNVISVQANVFFSPDGGVQDAVIDAIKKSTSTIRIQAYSFTSAKIANAIVAAKNRGIDVVAILDKSQRTQKYSSADFLSNEGVATYIDDQHAIAHNKVIIIDDNTVITGSYNFTNAAEFANAENLLILHSGQLAKLYANNWELHLKHSRIYTSKSKP